LIRANAGLYEKKRPDRGSHIFLLILWRMKNPPQAALDFASRAKANGMTHEEIRQELMLGGWTEEAIDEIISPLDSAPDPHES
jgi:hypothetical protein